MSSLNLHEILKGHEGEIFWSPLYGNVKLLSASYDENFPIRIEEMNEARRALLLSNGHYSEYDEGECMLFPSKDQRDWNKWIEEQKPKIPKTWSEFVDTNYNNMINGYYDYCIDVTGNKCNGWTRRNSPIEKLALALLKIHQLIEVGYGGNVKGRDKINFFAIQWSYQDKRFVIRNFGPFLEDCGTVACFHTKEQAIEFLSYPENVQLLKDYFMI